MDDTKTILIVDDSERIRRTYRRMLAEEGFEVVEAPTATDANEILKTRNINLVLLDIKMPEVDGSVLHELIASFHKKVKVIIASVMPLDEQREEIAGATDYYDKSQGIDLLLEKVTEALKGAG